MSDMKLTDTLQDPIEINYVNANQLILDKENPRFAGLSSKATEKEVLKKLQEEMHLDELIDSFEENGYYNTEPLLTIESERGSGKYIVIEGNRRLAAIKTLLGSGKVIRKELLDQLTKRIPIAVYPDRETLWSYLGFRHINGPQEWDSYSKAVYALRVHTAYKIPIEEIASRIGDRHLTVVKMCNGLRVLEQAERKGYFKADEIELRRFYFSHLYTILSYDNTRDFLGLAKKRNQVLKSNPVPAKALPNLKVLLEFLFGSKDGRKTTVIKSQNPDLKYLDNVLGSKKAVQYLKDNQQEYGALEAALAFTEGEDYRLEDLVFKVLNDVRKISGYLNRYKGNEEVYKDAVEANEILADIIVRMKMKRK